MFKIRLALLLSHVALLLTLTLGPSGCGGSQSPVTADATSNDAQHVDVFGQDSQQAACTGDFFPAACPNQSEPFMKACHYRNEYCDCPVPPNSSCIEAYPQAMNPPARWAPGLWPGTAKAYAGAFVWSAHPGPSTRYLVTLHGSHEIAEKELYWWEPRIRALENCTGQNFGVISIEYRNRENSVMEEYISFDENKALIDFVLDGEIQAGRAAPSGHAFHGFSAGSATIYSIAVLQASGPRKGTRFIADSGGFPPGVTPPPVAQALASPAKNQLAGTQFYVFYGRQDHDPDMNGANAAPICADIVRQLGGTATIVEDPTGCHPVMETGRDFDRAMPALKWAFDIN